MPELAKRILCVCLLGLSVISPTWADGMVRGQVLSVSGGDILELVDTQGREHRLRHRSKNSPPPASDLRAPIK